jgi:putative sporulation protein YtaF
MHGFLFAVLIALTNSIDNLGAWIALSIKGIKVTNLINLWISFITFILSAAACLVGGLLPGTIDGRICAWISFTLFVSMGVWFIADPVIKRRKKSRERAGLIDILEDPEKADANRSKDIDFKEATVLAVALSINNVGGSFSAGVIGLNAWVIGALSALVSFGALWIGRRISAFFERSNLGDAVSVLSGAVLILIGIAQVL